MYTQIINQHLLDCLHVLREIHAICVKSLEPAPSKNFNDEWLHTDDVARIFNKTERTIYAWRKANLIRYIKIKRTMYYLKSDIYDLLKK